MFYICFIMKRSLLTLLILFYLGTTSGMTVHFHYCMGKLASWGFTQPESTMCKICKAPKKSSGKSCCKDDYKQAKVDKSQKTSTTVYQFQPLTALQPDKTNWNLAYVPVPLETGKASLSHAPPLIGDTPVFIRNCTFRI